MRDVFSKSLVARLLLMMLVGFGGLGVVAYRRTRRRPATLAGA